MSLLDAKSEIIWTIAVQSLEEYIFVKIIVTKLKARSYVMVRKRQCQGRDLLANLEIELQYSNLSNEVLATLRTQLLQACMPITKAYKSKAESTWALQQFDEIIFGGAKAILLRSEYFQSLREDIEEWLFKDSRFEIERLKSSNHNRLRKIFNQSEVKQLSNPCSKWFLIQSIRQSPIAMHSGFQCKELIKLNGQLTINLEKLYRIAMQIIQPNKKKMELQTWRIKKQCKISFENLENIFMHMLSLKGDIFFQFSNKLTIYIRISFQSQQTLCQFLQNMHAIALEDCLEWNLDTTKVNSFNMSDFQSEYFRVAMMERMWPEELPESPNAELTQLMGNNFVITDRVKLLCSHVIDKDVVTTKKCWPQISNLFQEIIQNWSMNMFKVDDTFKKLIKQLAYKIDKFKFKYPQTDATNQPQEFLLLQFFCENSRNYIQFFKKKIQAKELITSKQEEALYPIMDRLLINYLDEINQNKATMIVKVVGYDPKQLKEFIADAMTYQENVADWEDVFSVITLNLKRMVKDNEKATIEAKTMSQQIQNIQFEAFPITQCYGCTQFFHLNVSIPRRTNSGAIRLIPFVSKIKQYESLIKQQICSMLNNNGGIILFNCTKEYQNILPQGAYITQKDKEAYENQIINLLNSIYPKPEITKNIVISFVPVMHHPLLFKIKDRKLTPYTGLDLELKPNQYYYNHTYIEGLYIPRIKVCPIDISKVYIWSSQNDIYYLSGFRKKNAKEDTKITKLSQAIKVRMKRYMNAKRHSFRSSTFGNPLSHECLTPDLGSIIKDKEQPVVNLRSGTSLEQAYNHISMIVVRNRYIPTVQQRLQKKGIDCIIETRFERNKFKVAHNTAVLFHNQKFEDVLRALAYNSDFHFEGKAVLAIYITQYVKLEESNERIRIKNEEVANVELWLKSEFPNENLRFFQFRRNATQLDFFIRTDSRLSTLFIYYVLNHFKIKTVFKNPLYLDRMPIEEKARVFTEINYKSQFNQSKEYFLNETILPRVEQLKT